MRGIIVVEVLVLVSNNGNDWRAALETVIPQRKLINKPSFKARTKAKRALNGDVSVRSSEQDAVTAVSAHEVNHNTNDDDTDEAIVITLFD
jgi:hypothetical protein